MRDEVRAEVGGRGAAAAQAARRGRVCSKPGVHGKAGAERTPKMEYMFVTLDVSKLSGWLNADADCRAERRACDAGRGAGCGGSRAWGGGGASGAQREGLFKTWGGRAGAERTLKM